IKQAAWCHRWDIGVFIVWSELLRSEQVHSFLEPPRQGDAPEQDGGRVAEDAARAYPVLEDPRQRVERGRMLGGGQVAREDGGEAVRGEVPRMHTEVKPPRAVQQCTAVAREISGHGPTVRSDRAAPPRSAGPGG